MSIPTTCCTLPPVESNYAPKGKDSSIGDGLVVYETGVTDSERLLICAYDIFGLHSNTKQFCDKLGSSGFRIVMPDFFRGQAFSQENFPPSDPSKIMEFINTVGSWDKTVKKDMELVIQHYKQQGIKKFGIFGFCWGAIPCVSSSAELFEDIRASVLIHPSVVGTQDADRVNCPTLLLPTKDDADFEPFYEKLKSRFMEGECGHHRFTDMHHGFAAARADLDSELNRKRVDEALTLAHDFFSRNLKV